MANIRKAMIWEICNKRFLSLDLILNREVDAPSRSTSEPSSRLTSKLPSKIISDFLSKPISDLPSRPTSEMLKKKRSKKANAFYKIAFNKEIVLHTEPLDIGLMDIICHHCRAKYFKGETKNCCSGGDLAKVLFPKLMAFENEIPDLFKQLYNGEHEFSDIFHENIRKLNSVFSFTSLGLAQNIKKDQQLPLQSNSTLGRYLSFEYY